MSRGSRARRSWSKSLSLNLSLIVAAGVFGVAVGVVSGAMAHDDTSYKAPGSSGAQSAPASPQTADPLLALDEPQQPPVITAQTPGATDYQYGFEAGRVVKVAGTYYMFATELAGTPRWFANRLAYWESTDGVHWTRPQGATLFESGPDFQGDHAGVFTPIPVFDDRANQWDLFYVAGNPRRIWRAISTVPAKAALQGPYKDVGVAMTSTDGFMPYSAGGRWYALHEGPSQFSPWEISLATAATLAGPWTPVTQLNPLTVERRFIQTLSSPGSPTESTQPYTTASCLAPSGSCTHRMESTGAAVLHCKCYQQDMAATRTT